MNQRILSRGFLLFFFAGFVLFKANAQCGGDIDFTNWTTYGANQNCNDCDNGGVWQVFNSGKSVKQTVNGGASYFVSEEEFIDVTIHGTFRVNTAEDDDWVGFVFGYKNPTDNSNKRQEYYLFDWKQLNQTTTSSVTGATYGTAKEGFCLMKINDSIDFTQVALDNVHHKNFLKTYWSHWDIRPEVERLDSLYGTQYGWVENTDVSFSLTYTTKKIVVVIDSDTIFNIDGCFEPGKFGFYNLSQAASEYKNFSYELIPDFESDIPDGCINNDIAFSAINSACQDAENYVSPIETWDWEFAPGDLASGSNITHSFETPGTYQVKLTVGDGGTCSTSITKEFQVKGLVLEADKDFLCASDNVILTATAITDATYSWYKDGDFFQNTATTPSLNISAPGVYYVEISGQTDYTCNTASNEVTITDGVPEATITATLTAVCTGGSTVLTAPPYTNASYTWMVDGGASLDPTNPEGNVLSATVTGDYTVVIETENGCTATSGATTLTQGVDPVISISSDVTEICPYELSTLTAVHDGANVAWYRNNSDMELSSNVIEVSQAGTYKAVTTGSDGCTATSSEISIVVKSLPVVTLSSSKPGLCPGESITLTVAQTGAASYVWKKDGLDLGGETGQSLLVSSEGDYESIVTSANGCADTSTVFNAQSILSPVSEFTSVETEFCAGESLALTATTVSGANYEWFLDGVSKKTGASNTYNLTAGGEVTLEVTSNGCSSISQPQTFIQNEIPDISITSQVSSLCEGTTGILAVSSGENDLLEWFKDNVSLGQDMEQSLEISDAGSYYVIVDNGKCTVTSSVISVTTKTVPSSLDDISGSFTYCEGYQGDYSVPSLAGVTYYRWSVSPSSAASIGEGQGTNQIKINFRNPSGTVLVSCTPENECGGGTVKNFSVTKDNLCIDYIKFSANKTVICQGGSVTFTAHTTPNPPNIFHYRFTFESGSGVSSVDGNTLTVTFDQPGTYDVTVTEVDNFNFEGAYEVKYDYIIVKPVSGSTSTISGEENPICNHSYTYTVTGSDETQFTWQVPSNASIISGQNTTSITVYFSSEGSGSVEAMSSSGSCESTPAGLEVNASCGTISGIANSFEQEFSLHPNPVTDFIVIGGVIKGKIYKMILKNEYGITVQEKMYTEGPVSLKDLPEGMYILILLDEETGIFRAEKFMKF